MIRNLKFEVWRLNRFQQNPDWKAGSVGSVTPYYISVWEMCKVHSLHLGTNKVTITANGGGNIAIALGPECILREYIGFADKKGKDIYSGDLVKRKNGDIRVVGYGAPSFWLYKDLNDEIDVDSFSTPCIEEEIVGTIYENPELLT